MIETRFLSDRCQVVPINTNTQEFTCNICIISRTNTNFQYAIVNTIDLENNNFNFSNTKSGRLNINLHKSANQWFILLKSINDSANCVLIDIKVTPTATLQKLDLIDLFCSCFHIKE